MSNFLQNNVKSKFHSFISIDLIWFNFSKENFSVWRTSKLKIFFKFLPSDQNLVDIYVESARFMKSDRIVVLCIILLALTGRQLRFNLKDKGINLLKLCKIFAVSTK